MEKTEKKLTFNAQLKQSRSSSQPPQEEKSQILRKTTSSDNSGTQNGRHYICGGVYWNSIVRFYNKKNSTGITLGCEKTPGQGTVAQSTNPQKRTPLGGNMREFTAQQNGSEEEEAKSYENQGQRTTITTTVWKKKKGGELTTRGDTFC